METLTGAVTLLNMFQVSIISFGATLVLTSDMCALRWKHKSSIFLKEKSIYNFFIMEVQKYSPSAAGKTSSCSISMKTHPNF